MLMITFGILTTYCMSESYYKTERVGEVSQEEEEGGKGNGGIKTQKDA